VAMMADLVEVANFREKMRLGSGMRHVVKMSGSFAAGEGKQVTA